MGITTKKKWSQLSSSFSLPQAFPVWIVKDLILLLHHHLLHPSTQLQLQFRTITLILARQTLRATASTRTPTATRWRRSFSRTSASRTPRRLASHKIRRHANRTG